MAQINLLSWRELRREREKKIFLIIMVVSIALSFLRVYLLNLHGLGLVSNQLLRHQIIQQEINNVEAQLKAQKKMRNTREGLMAKISLVQQLQSTQRLIIHLFHELINIAPSGVYFTQLEEKNEVYSLAGYAQSNKFISILMKNIEINHWLHEPILKEIKRNAKINVVGENKFKLTFVLASPL